MHDSQTPQALREALQFVMTSDIPSEHKSVLIELLTQAIRNQDNAEVRRQSAEGKSEQWQAHETEQLKTFLQGRVANSWQQADELAMHLAAQLHRSLHDIRAKATELGFGMAVDYRMAKARAASEPE